MIKVGSLATIPKAISCALATFLLACGAVADKPSALFLIQSWQSAADGLRDNVPSYSLEGECSVDSFNHTPLEMHTWRVIREGNKFRWEFRGKDKDQILTFDGKLWNTFIHQGKLINGNVVSHPAKILGEQPTEMYRMGIATVYPITAAQFLMAPYRLSEDVSMPDEYLSRIQRIQVSGPIQIDNETAYKIFLDRDSSAAGLGLPETIYFGRRGDKFVPIMIEHDFWHEGKIANRQIYHLGKYVQVGGELAPTFYTCKIEMSEKGGWTPLVLYTENYKITPEPNGFSPTTFSIDYPSGTDVFIEGRGWVSNKIAPQAKKKPEDHTVLVLVVTIVGALVCYGAFRGIEARARKS